MTIRARFARVAALVCVGALTLTGCDFSVYSVPLPGGADLGDDPYSVRVKMRNVVDLVPQSSVKVNDVTVGTVEEIELDGWVAEVTVQVRGDIELPENAIARIRQTSLLGEKFVSLEPPESGASESLLEDGDLIPLERSGRNPEVEEVLGALSLLLNGGGVAQLKTITSELNKALGGRESEVKSVLSELDTFMGQLDRGKGDIVEAIEKLNRLAISINDQERSIKLALDELPQGLASIDRQREDLVRMLDALTELSAVGTEVIQASKADTIKSLEELDPVLTKLAEAGDAFPNALQVFLTYPFVDAVVGVNPAQARNLHMGDYTNLSVQLDLTLDNIGNLANSELETIREECAASPLDPVCDEVFPPVQQCLQAIINDDPNARECVEALPAGQLDEVCAAVPGNPLTAGLCGSDGDGGGGGALPEPELPELPGPDDPGDALPDGLGGEDNQRPGPVDRCLNNSRGADSRACRDLNRKQERRLERECERPTNLVKQTCRDLRSNDGGGGGGLLGDDGGLSGSLGRAEPGPGLREPDHLDREKAQRPSYNSDLGAMLVWGLMQR